MQMQIRMRFPGLWLIRLAFWLMGITAPLLMLILGARRVCAAANWLTAHVRAEVWLHGIGGPRWEKVAIPPESMPQLQVESGVG